MIESPADRLALLADFGVDFVLTPAASGLPVNRRGIFNTEPVRTTELGLEVDIDQAGPELVVRAADLVAGATPIGVQGDRVEITAGQDGAGFYFVRSRLPYPNDAGFLVLALYDDPSAGA